MSEENKTFSFGENGNLAIKASAGTGKTFRLAMRFIALLHCDPDLAPERIVAITFTRKAAAEILDKILEELLEMKEKPEKLAGLVKDGLLPQDFTPSAIPGILARILTARELQISTIDSFFVKIIQAFAPEFGLVGTVEMIDENRDSGEKETIAALIHQEEKNLLPLLRDYALGKEARNFTSTLKDFLEDNYEAYLLYPDENLWGNLPDVQGDLSNEELEKINTLLNVTLTRYNQQCEQCRDAVKQIQELLSAANSGIIGKSATPLQMVTGLDGELEPLLPQLLEQLANPHEHHKALKQLKAEQEILQARSESAIDAVKKIQLLMNVAKNGKIGNPAPSIKYKEKDGKFYVASGNKGPQKLVTISFEMMVALNKLSLHIAVLNLKLKKEKTRAAYHILKCYDELYAANVRNAGRLTFRDIPKLLGKIPWENKQDIEYRLDTKNLHYMLDEFQDTSTQQWAFMSNLMTEAISGKDKGQSFFVVGDVKQSLYQWRFGNPKLFDAVCRGKMKQETLDLSRRSAPVIIAAVNGVFDESSCDNVKNDAVRNAIRRSGFINHDAYKKDSGCAMLQQLSKIDDNDTRARDRAEKILKILQKTTPFEHHRSVAILLRTNDEIARYKQCLRALDEELPISTEGAIMPKESMACTFLTLLLRLAAHPGDDMARNALPLLSWKESNAFTAGEIAEKLQLPRCTDYEALSSSLRVLLQETGIHGLVSRFQSAYESRLSEFDRDCLVIAATQAVDFTGSIDEYLTLLKNASGLGVSVKNTVQIMTIHKSKGLEFDMVFLPELGAFGGGGERLKIAPMDERKMQDSVNEDLAWLKPDFVSYLPVQFARPFLPEIDEIYEQIENDEIYEKVCGLYVAMTRAKRALYMFVSDDTGTLGKSFRADQLLVQTLGGAPPVGPGVLYFAGTDDWYKELSEDEKKPKEKKQPREITLTELSAKRYAVPLWQSPSRHENGGEEAFSTLPEHRFDDSDAAELGTRIHAMFEEVEYLDSVNEEKIRSIAGEDDLAAATMELWKKTMVPDGEIARALTRPEGDVVLWREKNFLIQNTEGKLISGCFDRVEIHRDTVKTVKQVIIYDYKSDKLNTPNDFLERHQTQLNMYREACSQMLCLPKEKIECVILALRLNQAIPVPLK